MAVATNPNRWKKRRELSAEPSHLARRGIPPRGEVIAPPLGQQVLQATLLEIFAHPTREHPWNPTGRTLTELYLCYGSWVSPQPDRIIMGSTLAQRMASYLLPYVKNIDSDFPHCRGIPGLRYRRGARYGYELVHLPTQTTIEIRDGNLGRNERLLDEAQCNRDDPGYIPLWQETDLTEVERQWNNIWRPSNHTPLNSAWFNALRMLDTYPDGTRKSARDAVFQPAATDGTPAYLRWCGTLTPQDAVDNLTTLGVGAYGEPLTLSATAPGFAIATAGGVSIELHQRPVCPGCRETQNKWHGSTATRSRGPANVGAPTTTTAPGPLRRPKNDYTSAVSA
ncbi:hypothetical protein [Actinoplanes sp. NPDC020271]|uniref:hypothetical protein n=1 Tax=Actinoplanes sp. NPDC020271 TaxID=3363896 RepID=UPI00378E713F